MTKKLLEELPAKLIISSTQLEVSNTPLGQGSISVPYEREEGHWFLQKTYEAHAKPTANLQSKCSESGLFQ